MQSQATYLLTLLSCFVISTSAQLIIKQHDTTVLVGRENYLELLLTNVTAEERTINIRPQYDGLVEIEPDIITVNQTSGTWNITVRGVHSGHVLLSANITQNTHVVNTDDAYTRVTVQISSTWEIVSQVIGWIYFVAWSISFYPQMYDNWKRKSVVGLNFDFLALNLLGFILYSLFNAGLYWIPEVMQDYMDRHPKGLNPILVNDIVFAFHATFAVVLTIIQCFIYERGDQRVSTPAYVLFGIYFVFLLVSVILASTNVINWLDFLYYCSYVKLSITLIKYIPQAYMNYKRKSTVGWSIGNIFLDFTGGILSMGQMIINSWNYDDWQSIFGDPTKFGLGLFSVLFDIFFIVQHYCLYRRVSYDEFDGDVVNTGSYSNSRTELTS